MSDAPLKAPFPYFGGKRRVAALVWERFGDVQNFIEPFMGSAAVLLARPHPPRVETANDADCYVANFWRATSIDPEAVAIHADGPVNEADLHARHRWLVLSDEAAEFRRRMRTDPDFYDPKIAGWWCWGLCCWIGGGWCSERCATLDKVPAPARENGVGGANSRGVHAEKGPDQAGITSRPDVPERRPTISGDNPGSYGKGVHARGPKECLPHLSGDSGAAGRGVHASAGPATWEQRPDVADGTGRGVHSKRPNIADRTHGSGVLSDHNRPQLADAFARGRGIHGNDAADTCALRRAWLLDWFGRLRDRLRTVRVCCGDWIRVCDSHSVTTRLGTTGIFLDPPYSTEAGRDMNLYATESGTVAHEVRAYCLERGSDPLMRIALCGYAGEGHEELEAHGWECVAWKASGGYGNRSSKGKENAAKERIWFSPHCVKPRSTQSTLFGD